MDGTKNASVLCTALLFILYIGCTSGQDRCITVKQDGTSLHHGPTKLVCQIKERIKCDFLIMWAYHVKETAIVERRSEHITVNNIYPEEYDCQWMEDEMASVLTIKNTTSAAEGDWSCNFMDADGCIGSLNVDVIVQGRISELRTL